MTVFIKRCYSCSNLSAEYEAYTLSDSSYKIDFDTNGMIKYIRSKKHETVVKDSKHKIISKIHEIYMAQQLVFYTGKSSGAYVFQPGVKYK